jgi:hypothetical protein
MNIKPVVFTLSEVNIKNIVFDQPQVVSDNLIIKILSDASNILTNLFIQTNMMRILEVSDKSIICESDSDNKFYDCLDNHIINFIKKSKIISMYGLKNIKYKTTVNEFYKKSVIVFRYSEQTKFYLSDKRQINDITQYLKPDNMARIIFEPHSVVVDLKNNEMHTIISMRQIVFDALPVYNMTLDEYSFTETDKKICLDVDKSDSYTSDSDKSDKYEILKKTYSDADESDSHKSDSHKSDSHKSDSHKSDSHKSDSYKSDSNKSKNFKKTYLNANQTDLSESSDSQIIKIYSDSEPEPNSESYDSDIEESDKNSTTDSD